MKIVAIIGGGAAGFFSAITCKQHQPQNQVIIFEKAAKVLQKVRISGGGRCNVTHACFDPNLLAKNYPRGEKQLLGPFNKFNPTDTIEWFAERGVKLKAEADGRMFPVTDSSQTIIDCFMSEAEKSGVELRLQCGVDNIRQTEKNRWLLELQNGKTQHVDAVIVTAGSAHHVWDNLKELGIKTVPPVASLFTFNISDARIKNLQGLSVQAATVRAVNSKLEAVGPLLVTHWGLSGPAVLRLSAWGARELAAQNYRFDISVNFTQQEYTEVREVLKQYRASNPKKIVMANPMFDLPKRLWESFVTTPKKFADLSNAEIENIANSLTKAVFHVTGKSTFKDEFVTAGGVDLNEVDFKTMQCKKLPNLYFAGEVLDIDGITGGFNFQSAWTTSFIAGKAAAEDLGKVK
jgi:predicted Rossmann fold flavoprotein